jgi:ATP-dependent Clp protease ATP-binding subunit ClpB
MKMLQGTRKLLHLEEELHRRVVGQEEGEAVSDAVRRSRAGLQDMRENQWVLFLPFDRRW